MDNRQGFSAEGAIGIDELIGVLKEATPQISRYHILTVSYHIN